MSKISRSIKNVTRTGNLFPATVIDAGGGTATVRLSNSGAIYRNLNVVGGTVKKGDFCYVDFSAYTPIVLAQGNTSTTTVSSTKVKKPSRAGIGSKTNGVTSGSSSGTGEYGIFLYGYGTIKTSYPATSEGMTNALSEASSTDVIYLPNCSIDGDYEIPDGVHLIGMSRYGSSLTGDITLIGNNYIENLTISGSSSGPKLEISGSSTVKNSDIKQYGTGPSVLVSGGASTMRECYIYSAGTGVSGTGGSCLFFGTDFDCLIDVDCSGFTATIYGNQLSQIVGTPVYGKGDRAAFSGEHHSSDIEDETFSYHTPIPTSGSGQTLISNGSGWYADTLPEPDYTNHNVTHGHNGADEFIHVSSGSPAETFAGKLWLEP